MNTTYILQQELPDSKVGDEYIYNNSNKAYYKNGNVQDSFWLPEWVENNPKWFKPKEERITINHLKHYHTFLGSNGSEYWYQFSSSHPLETKSNLAIRNAIEFIVNNPNEVIHE